jgi:GNAT superfamily N-acetyltransferase
MGLAKRPGRSRGAKALPEGGRLRPAAPIAPYPRQRQDPVGIRCPATPVTIEAAAPGLPATAEILRDYLDEMISRYYGRSTDDAEIDQYLGAGHDSDDLVEPTGVLLAQSADGGVRPRPIGCVGLRRLDEQTRELTRMFVRPEARGAGVAAMLLTAAE